MQNEMAQHISAEKRANILSLINDEGMSIIDAAKTFSVTEDTIKKWMRKQNEGHTSNAEVQRLKQENQDLRTIIDEMLLQQKKKKRHFFR